MSITAFSDKEKKDIAGRLGSTNYSQLRTIVYELLDNLNAWIVANPNNDYKETDKEYFENCINDLLLSLRSCHPTPYYELSELLWLYPDEFTNKSEELSAEDKEEIKYLYENFWHPNSIIELFNSGKIKDYTAYKVLVVDKVEDAASQYLRNNLFKSKTLEYLLVDSLIFAETVAFANELDDFPVPEYWKAMAKLFWIILKFLIKESFALTITWIISNVAGGSETISFWIVFSAITVIRWLNPTKFHRLKLEAKPKILLGEMVNLYDIKLKTSSFNANLFRELLYNIEKKGASYSPWVYHILDRKIKDNT